MQDFDLSDEEMATVIPILQKILWADKKNRKKIQKMGINVLPCDFYSSTPSIEEIEDSFEYFDEKPSYFNENLFDKNHFLQTIEKLLPFSKEFNPPDDGDEENCTSFFWNNSQFSKSDAMTYYCFIRLTKPSAIVEIGSGFSTLAALEAIEKNGYGTLTCIEPFPRIFLKKNKKINLRCLKAQNLQAEFLNDTFKDGDILFIDSTHTVKSGSDCLHIYLRLLPEIRRNILVHVHDVFLPYGLPKEWLLDRQIFWTEQYLLLALLIDNPKTNLLYGSYFNSKQYPIQMERYMRGKSQTVGGSLWFKYNGRTNFKGAVC